MAQLTRKKHFNLSFLADVEFTELFYWGVDVNKPVAASEIICGLHLFISESRSL